jgi:ComEC/Rec2-related protein
MKAPLSRVPALPAAVGLAIGVFIDVSTHWNTWSMVAAMTLVILGAMLLIFARRHIPVYWICLAMFCGVGVMLSQVRRPAEPIAGTLGVDATLTARVEKVMERDNVTMLYVKASTFSQENLSIPMHCGVAVTVSGDVDVVPGDIITVQGRLRDLSGDNNVPDAVDYSRYLFIDGITARMFVQAGKIAVVSNESTLFEQIQRKGAESLGLAIVKSGVNGSTTAFLLATIAGDDLYLDPWLRDGFRANGLAHILALSGLHVGIIVLLVSLVLYPLKCLPRGWYVFYPLLILAVFTYAVVVGMTPSVARAMVMAVIFMLAKMSNHRPAPANSLCVTIVLWLVINPFWLFSPGFQLSIFAVIAILSCGVLLRRLPIDKPFLRWLVELAAIPVAAMAGTAMLSVFYYHALPLTFLPANIVASLLVGPIVGIGAILAVFSFAGISISWLATVEDWLYGLLEKNVQFFASLGKTEITGIYPEPWQMALFIVALSMFIMAISFKRERFAWVGAVMTTMFVTSMVAMPRPLGSEIYLTGNAHSTDIILRHDNRAIFVSTATDREAALDRANTIYKDFLGRRGCGVSFATEAGDFDLGPYSRRGNTYFIRDTTMMLVAADSLIVNVPKVDILAVAGRFTGDVVEIAGYLNADSVILCRDVRPARRLKFARHLDTARIAYSEL